MTIKTKGKQLFVLRAVGAAWLGLMVWSMWGYQNSLVAQQAEKGEIIPVLIFGTDAADASRHTDTLMMGALDPLKDSFRVLNIPRDTRVRIPGYRFRRVNEIFGYHNRKTENPDLAAKEVLAGVEHLLGAGKKEVRLPYYVFLDYSGFRKIIDLLGGVWLTVKTPMHYDDYAGDYHFHKEPGRYRMNGDEALKFVRYRGQTGDRGRILRQQEFLRAAATRLANPLNVFRFPQIMGAVASTLNTNLGVWDTLYMVTSARKVRAPGLGFYILPGRPSGPYWEMKTEAGHELAMALLEGQSVQVQGLTPIVPQLEKITVKVFNASGRRGLAYRVTRYLREQGYDVVDWGNYPVVQVPSRVVDRTGVILKAKKVSENLGIQTYHSEPSRAALADVEVIIGKNYTGIGTIDGLESL